MSLVDEIVFADPPAARSTPAFPYLGAEVWPGRLRQLQAHPCRWARWRGASTTAPERAVAALRWAARGLDGCFELLAGECEAGGPLTFARWVPPLDERAIDLRPLARAETMQPVSLILVDPAGGRLAVGAVEGSA